VPQRTQKRETQDPGKKSNLGHPPGLIKEGSLDFAARRAAMRLGRKKRDAPLGMTIYFRGLEVEEAVGGDYQE
jgi:hypothetical protein